MLQVVIPSVVLLLLLLLLVLLLLLLLSLCSGCCAAVCCAVGGEAVPPLTHGQQVRWAVVSPPFSSILACPLRHIASRQLYQLYQLHTWPGDETVVERGQGWKHCWGVTWCMQAATLYYG
jgi:hypothetical protein